MRRLNIVHFLNQFYAGIGAEEKAETPLQVLEGPVGPGREIARLLGDRGRITATLVAGDNWSHQDPDEALGQMVSVVKDLRPDALLLGPAFASGRYGVTCGRLAVAAQERLDLRAVVTAMHLDNPAVEMFRRKVVIVSTTQSAVRMAAALDRMVRLALKLASGEPLGGADAEGYIARGLRRNVLRDHPAAERAVAMLLARMAGRPFTSEIPAPRFAAITPAPPIVTPRQATLAVVTTGGVVPRGNPDRIESRFASKWGRYAIAGLTSATPDTWEDVHGGFDNHFLNEDPNRVLPLDVLRELEGNEFGRLFPEVISTVGNMMAIDKAELFATEIARLLVAHRIEGVVFAVT